MFITPVKVNDEQKLANKLTNPEALFTPLKIPCSTKNDSLDKSKFKLSLIIFTERVLFSS